VAAFGTGASRPLQGRGGSPGFRFTLYAILSIVIMFLDQRGAWLERARYVLQAAAYPIQLAVSSPSAAWRWLQESFETRDALRVENERLRVQERELALRSMRYEALARENDQLRGLKEALPSVAERWLVAEVVNIQLNSLRQRVLINRGTSNGVFKGQAVLDEKGLLGQTTHVGPWSAEVILLTDPEHAVPVQIERNGLRTIAVGAGDAASLALPYLPANADVKSGDLLLSSGLGGVFPAGYPVGRITEVHREAVQPLAHVRATPLARVDLDREVELVWFREGHPASPGAAPAAGTTGDLPSGSRVMQPQAAPPHPLSPSSPATGTTAPSGAPGATTTRPQPAAPRAAAPSAPSGPEASAPPDASATATPQPEPGSRAPAATARPKKAAKPPPAAPDKPAGNE
jgi:rod shape-determining protein MreC